MICLHKVWKLIVNNYDGIENPGRKTWFRRSKIQLGAKGDRIISARIIVSYCYYSSRKLLHL